MPWVIEIKHGKHCVYKQKVKGGPGVGPALHCWATHDEAVQQLRGLYASERDSMAAAAIPSVASYTTPEAPTQLGDPGEPIVLGPFAAGLAMLAGDTGRVLLLQRALDPADPNGGLWELPGGKMDPGETPLDAALREFNEETGIDATSAGDPVGMWLDPTGVYQLYVGVTPVEADIDIHMATPADPDGEDNETLAWFDPCQVPGMPSLRPECDLVPWVWLETFTGGHTEDSSTEDVVMASMNEIVVPVRIEVVGDGVPSMPNEIHIHTDSEETADMVAAAFHEPSHVAAAFDTARRKALSKKGFALPDGSFPIVTVMDLQNAIKSAGRATDSAKAKSHIIKRARALGKMDLIPSSWTTKSMAASLTAALTASSSAFLPAEQLPGPTPFSVADDGTVDGHLALWASCHAGYPTCVRPPREADFSFFNLGEVITADGRSVPVGKVTVGGGHAGPDLNWRTAAAQYDDTGTQVAVVHAAPDKWGIRLSGSLLASASEEQIDELRRSPLSGDWRKVAGQLRLVAALAVNVPGYPIQRSLVASGEPDSLIWGEDWSSDDLVLEDEANSLAASIGLDHASRAAELRRFIMQDT